jgi:hypothetical protein
MVVLTVALTMIVLVFVSLSAYAQADSRFNLTWSTVDAGGYTFSTGGNYSLGGTAGQPDAGVLTGGRYALGGGFWGGGFCSGDLPGNGTIIYLPIIIQ